MEMYNYAVHYGLCCYCSLVIFREVFFASESHSNILSGEYPLITVSVSFCAII